MNIDLWAVTAIFNSTLCFVNFSALCKNFLYYFFSWYLIYFEVRRQPQWTFPQVFGIVNRHLVIQCSILGRTSWLKNGEALPRHLFTHYMLNHHRISFTHVQESDAGIYECYKREFFRISRSDAQEVLIASM